MLLKHLSTMFSNPKQMWQDVHAEDKSIADCYREYIIILGLIPPLAGLIGTTQFGWQLGWGEPIKLTFGSALTIAVLYFLAILVAVAIVGKAIHWMATTYGATPTLAQCVLLAAITGTPLLLSGILQLYPVLFINFLFGLMALAYAVYLLYSGVPIMMDVSAERGFLFSSAVVTFGMVALVAMLVITVILWGFGVGPEFTQ